MKFSVTKTQSDIGLVNNELEPDAVVLFGDGLPNTPKRIIKKLGFIDQNSGIKMDLYGLGGSVQQLEVKFAHILGKETAVWMPTGTLANHLAVRALCGNRPRVIIQKESHLYHDEGDGLARLSGINAIPLAEGRPTFSIQELKIALNEANSGRVSNEVGCVVIESPVRRQAGQIVPLNEMIAITNFCRAQGIGTHLDGARLYMMSAVTGVSPKRYADLFDTVYVSLYKYFGAPMGAVLAGPTIYLDGIHHERRMYGGGLASAAIPASLALHTLKGFETRFAKAMSKGLSLFADLNNVNGISVVHFDHGSNVFELRLDNSIHYGRLRASLQCHGIVLKKNLGDWPTPLISINETIMRQENSQLVNAFKVAVAQASNSH